MKSKLLLPAGLAALMVLFMPDVSEAAPVISRAHFEFPVAINDCGIGVLDLSIDAFNLVNLADSPDDTFRGTFTTVNVGTASDSATALTYRFVDRFTQKIVIRAEQPFVNTAERTLVITGGEGGLLGRGVVHSTVLPGGTVVSDVDLQFVRCL